jgi:hypothetical protein
MKDSSGKFVQSFMEVDNLFTGACQHKQTSNFCFSLDLGSFEWAVVR